MKTEKTERKNEQARPNAGTNTLDRKPKPEGQSGESAFAYRFSTTNKVVDAEESDSQSAKGCLDAQLGRGEHSASRTGGRLGDSTPQPSAAAPASDECGCGE
jgi:hypothetical protein